MKQVTIASDICVYGPTPSHYLHKYAGLILTQESQLER